MTPIRLTNWPFVLLSTILAYSVVGVDRNNFKTCQQSSFCRRCRGVEPGKSPYALQLNTLRVEDSSVEAILINTNNLVQFKFQLFALLDATFRMKINELAPLKPRYEVQYALVGEPSLAKLEVLERSAEHVTLRAGDNKVKIYGAPFRLDFYSGDHLVISSNARGLMRFEHIRQKPEKKEEVEGEQLAKEAPVDDDTASDPGAWEENFKSFQDSKPNGPEAVALDFSFVGAQNAFGIPEHADSFALKSTKGTDPYRLYNLDVFEYEINNGMSLYGAIPLIVAHGVTHTTGVFWLNSAETWVDIMGTSDQNVVSSIVNFVSGADRTPQVDAHFISESGIIDTFFMLGPQPKDVFRQYTKLTGTAPLPQYFTLGYHQSRWNYNDQDDVRNVHAKFDEHDLPMDVMWLDIEHTDNKKYFTWDQTKFTQPLDMINNLTAKGRKLVIIVDPHIKRDGNYFLHQDAENNGYYVKNKEGKDFEGWCWPGSSSYLDLFNPVVRDYYSSRYLLENHQGSTLDLYIWNDMNEPSVFSGPEVTMDKDCIHHGGWEHRDVHNIYGFMQSMASYKGLLDRSEGKLRPFLLTRSFFPGSQRYTAMWTGDNSADWSHLKITIPMCLSVALAGMSFCGADVGGFFKTPDSELIVRWYQLGAFQPFFRAHSHIDTKRREPWLYDEQTLMLIREVLRKRYSYLPYWYTLFYEHEKTGAPVMRPLWAEFPSELATFTIDDEHLIGNALLVHPVTDSGASSVNVYFPGPHTWWYSVDTYQKYVGGTNIQIPVNIRSIPVYQRGGTIIPKKERIRRSSVLSFDDPYTLIVALDKNNSAAGTLYIDDGESFEYRSGKYLYLSLQFDGKTLSSSFIDHTQYPTKSWLERVIIVGWQTPISQAQVTSKSVGMMTVETVYKKATQTLVIRKPTVSMTEEWTIKLQ
uniref:Glucosidase II subunit alpha n=1 Tax=Timema douglasi TaxID=61478 RepID=A0A7R8Z3B4_TIMDO|nr:unnamed protein product [Timema douglasi]